MSNELIELNENVSYEEYVNGLSDIIAKSKNTITTTITLDGVSKRPMLDKILQVPRNIRAEKLQYNGKTIKAKILKYVDGTYVYDMVIGIKSNMIDAMDYFKYIIDVLDEHKSSDNTNVSIEFGLNLPGDHYYNITIYRTGRRHWVHSKLGIYMPERTITVGEEKIAMFPITNEVDYIEAFVLSVVSAWRGGVATWDRR